MAGGQLCDGNSNCPSGSDELGCGLGLASGGLGLASGGLGRPRVASGGLGRRLGAATQSAAILLFSLPRITRPLFQLNRTVSSSQFRRSRLHQWCGSALSDDALNVIFKALCNVLDLKAAVGCSSASRGLHAATPAFREQLQADHEAATALCITLGLLSCTALHEACHIHGRTRASRTTTWRFWEHWAPFCYRSTLCT